uniref:ABC-2 type transporter transmembrane domain-containing protein n=1 Tax=Panagrolaimus sp. JU765 TaxID=591449 RepID=A0AC34RP21_9BILA
MALQVDKCLCILAGSDRNVFLTVHQPSSEIFEMFDKMIVSNALKESAIHIETVFVKKTLKNGKNFVQNESENRSMVNGVSNLKGALFYYISELTYATCFGIQTFMPADFPLIVREHHDGIYPMVFYYLSKVLSYMPLFTIDGILMVSISPFLIGFEKNVSAFFMTVIT